MRPLCYCPEGGSVIETCTRTLQGRFLLRPGPQANEIMLGVLGRALDYYHVEIFGLCFLSNHYHLLFKAESALQIARFQGFLNSNLARKLGRQHRWTDRFWARRYHSTIISEEPDAQLNRLKYLLANGTKEHLVSSPLEWPGPNMARAILHDEPLVGYWFNQTKEWAARRRGEEYGRYDYATRYEIELQRLPAFRHLSNKQYRDLVLDLVVEIQEEATVQQRARKVLGVERIKAQDPHEAPRKVKKSTAPKLFFASTRERLDNMKEEYKSFVILYRKAADHLLTMQDNLGRLDPRSGFPKGCFPPALQFLGKKLLPPPPRPPSRRLKYAEKGTWRIAGRGEIPVIKLPRPTPPGPAGYNKSISPDLGVRCHSPPISKRT